MIGPDYVEMDDGAGAYSVAVRRSQACARRLAVTAGRRLAVGGGQCRGHHPPLRLHRGPLVASYVPRGGQAGE
eukprot:scaffold1421_cov293-Prasinococcus_capsulatus_cf.AAC.10